MIVCANAIIILGLRPSTDTPVRRKGQRAVRQEEVGGRASDNYPSQLTVANLFSVPPSWSVPPECGEWMVAEPPPLDAASNIGCSISPSRVAPSKFAVKLVAELGPAEVAYDVSNYERLGRLAVAPAWPDDVTLLGTYFPPRSTPAHYLHTVDNMLKWADRVLCECPVRTTPIIGL